MGAGALSIKLRCASWQQLATIYRRDLSKGTMFLKASTPPPAGTQVQIDLTLPSGSVIVLNGAVFEQVNDPVRGVGVDLKLAPIPAGSIWMIESALASETSIERNAGRAGRVATQPGAATSDSQPGVPQPIAPVASGPIMSVGDGDELSEAEIELVRALVSEAESLKKLNPFLVLGVGYEASDADVRAAFGELTKRYHPDRFARYQSVQLRSTAAEIFILIRDAYRRLGDEAGRLSVLSALGRTAAPRAVASPQRPGSPAQRAAAPRAVARTPVGGVPIATTTGTMPRMGMDPRTGPIRTVGEPAGDAVRVPEAGQPLSPAATAPSQPFRPVAPASRAQTQPIAPLGPPPRPALPVRVATGPVPSLARVPSVPPLPPVSQTAASSGERFDAATSHGEVERLTADVAPATPAPIGAITDAADAGLIEDLLDAGRTDDALNAYRLLAKKYPTDRNFRAGIELCEGLTASAHRDRLEAAQRFEAALEIDPSNERAARELADMRRQATNERKGLLSRLMGKKEAT